MDDRLQRRLRDADPLIVVDGDLPDPARLDAIKEQLMQSETTPARPAFRPRALGLTALAATGLAMVLIVGTLVRPTGSALAWDPTPTAASDTQKADAATACAAGLPTAGGGAPAGGVAVPAPDASGLPVIDGGGAVPGGGTVVGGTAVTVGGDGGVVLPLPPMPTELPPLVTLELHGSGGVAVFADDHLTAYCLLVKDGEKLVSGGLMFPDLGDGTAAGVGTIGAAPGQGGSSGMVAVGGANGFEIAAMATTYKDQVVGIIAGQAPEVTATIKVAGGPADGATATADHGRFALWAPGSLQDQDITVTALDASGKVIATQSFAKAPAAPVVTETTKPKP
ncbi:MAG: hypothetical protein WCK58_04085 [Chloroflexota bacterium]